MGFQQISHRLRPSGSIGVAEAVSCVGVLRTGGTRGGTGVRGSRHDGDWLGGGSRAGEGCELRFCALGLIPSAREIDARGHARRDHPANRPRPPYALCAQHGVEGEAQRDADDEVDEGGEHE